MYQIERPLSNHVPESKHFNLSPYKQQRILVAKTLTNNIHFNIDDHAVSIIKGDCIIEHTSQTSFKVTLFSGTRWHFLFVNLQFSTLTLGVIQDLALVTLTCNQNPVSK